MTFSPSWGVVQGTSQLLSSFLWGSLKWLWNIPSGTCGRVRLISLTAITALQVVEEPIDVGRPVLVQD